MLDLLKKSFLTGVGLLAVTTEKAEALAKELVKHGELKAEESKAFVDSLLKEADKEREEFSEKVSLEVQKALGSMGLVSKAEVEELQARVEKLEEKLYGSEEE